MTVKMKARCRRGCHGGFELTTLGRRADQIRNTGLATNISCIPLETSEIVPGGGHPATRKRDAGCLEQSKASSTHEPVLRDEGHKRARQSYGLKPRHKTHEDHYEYKGPLSALETQSQPRKGRTKRRGCRKHTMNDDFHAMNVTENRLTVSILG